MEKKIYFYISLRRQEIHFIAGLLDLENCLSEMKVLAQVPGAKACRIAYFCNGNDYVWSWKADS